MAEYALIEIATNVIREFREFALTPLDVTRKGIKWLPVVVTNPPATSLQIKEGPVITVEAERVTRVWTVRDKTPAEIDAEKEDYLDNIERLGFEIDFDHENRIRVLEARPTVTAAQFRAALKARL
jgi:hypothetical protein